jgi:hypothetical protein
MAKDDFKNLGFHSTGDTDSNDRQTTSIQPPGGQGSKSVSGEEAKPGELRW